MRKTLLILAMSACALAHATDPNPSWTGAGGHVTNPVPPTPKPPRSVNGPPLGAPPMPQPQPGDQSRYDGQWGPATFGTSLSFDFRDPSGYTHDNYLEKSSRCDLARIEARRFYENPDRINTADRKLRDLDIWPAISWGYENATRADSMVHAGRWALQVCILNFEAMWRAKQEGRALTAADMVVPQQPQQVERALPRLNSR